MRLYTLVVILWLSLIGWLLIVPAQSETLKAHANETYHPPIIGIVGINFAISPHAHLPIIEEVYPYTPASKAGLTAGDTVVAINSMSTRGLSVEEIDQAISHIPGDLVKLLVNRQGYVFLVELTVQDLDDIRSQQVQALYSQIFGYPH